MYFNAPKPIDKKKFAESNFRCETYYGLPKEIKFCKRCVISNQRPGSTVEYRDDGSIPKSTIFFGDDGICDACKVRDSKQIIDWDEREKELKDICDKYRRNDGHYDVLIPGSGGKDSFVQAHLLKYKYGMNPLTCTWAPHIYTDWGWKNHNKWIHAGFDNILFTPNGRVHRLLTRVAVENLFHPFQPFILGQKNLAPKIASQYGIKLIMHGESGAEYGHRKKSDINKANQALEYHSGKTDEKNTFLGGSSLEELKGLGLKSVDFDPYLPIDPSLINDNEIEIQSLGYYIKWHPQSCYYYAVEHGNFESAPERSNGSYTTYSSIDDKIDDFFYHTYWIKFGIGRATSDSSQEIRSGDISREEGVALVNKFDGEFPNRWSEEIFKYLSINEREFPKAFSCFEKPIFDSYYYETLSEKFRSPHLWNWSEKKGWSLRKTVFDKFNIKDQESEAKNWIGNKNHL